MDIQKIIMFLKTIISVIGRFINTLVNYFERITAYFSMFYFITLVIIVITVFFFNRVNNDSSKKEIDKLIKNKKYIPHLFIELDESKECLRYFIYSMKWKKKLISEYNSLFKDYYGSILKSAFAHTNAVFDISKRSDIDNVLLSIKNTKQQLDDFRKGEDIISLQYQESLIKFKVFNDMYGEQLEQLLLKANMIKNRYCVVTGNAGNGKTNLLCNVSELLIKQKKRCFFVNAKDLSEDLENHIWKMMPINNRINCKMIKIVFWLVQRLFRKKVFVVVDAINENDILSTDQITNSINRLLKHKSVRLIISCRNEYFETKFKECLIEDVDESSTIINTEEMEFDTNSKRRLFDVYKEAFNYTGIVSGYVKEKLMNQLLMMRIFFETNSNSDKDYNDLNAYELIDDYTKQVEQETGKDVKVYLETITEKMIKDKNYNYVSLSSINKEDQKTQESIEGTLLTSKTIIKNENRLLENGEVSVQFVFDEVRDYFLARGLLNNTSNGEMDYPSDEEIKNIVKKLTEEEAVCTEGVIKYIYRDSHKAKSENICEYILNNCAGDITDSGNQFGVKGLKWDLSLILDSSEELFDCEKEYLEKEIVDNYFMIMNQLFPYLYKQELYGREQNLSIILNVLKKIDDKEKVASIINKCFSGYGPNGMDEEDIIEYDEDLEKKSVDGVDRFREIVLLYCCFYDWPDKGKLLDYLEDKDKESIIKRIKKDYKCFDKEENNDY